MKKRMLIIVISSAILSILIIALINTQNVPSGKILAKGPVYGRGYKGLRLIISVDNIDDVMKNKTIAETYLPQLINEADKMKVKGILVLAIESKWGKDRTYGYVWEKNNDGKWCYFYPSDNKKADYESMLTLIKTMTLNADINDKFIGKWKLSKTIANGIEYAASGGNYVIIDKSQGKYVITAFPDNIDFPARLSENKLRYIDNGVVSTFSLTDNKDELNLHVKNERFNWDVVCVRVE